MPWTRQIQTVAIAALAVAAACHTSPPPPFPFPANVRYEPTPYIADISDTSSQAPVPHRTVEHSFAEDGVTVRTAATAGRLNGVSRVGADHYRLLIEPENAPINDSAWYGLVIEIEPGTAAGRPVTLELDYRHGSHRYRPKIRPLGDPGPFAEIGEVRVLREEQLDERRVATLVGFDVVVPAAGLEVFAQPPADSAAVARWVAAMATHPEVERGSVGRSVLDRDLPELVIGHPGSGRTVVVIGRQHPPEVTGWEALRHFSERLCEDDPLATDFRGQVETIVLPLINPDGVDHGHWRSNHHGVDLNRDWMDFHQPETRHVRDRLHDHPQRIVFAIDFHSTHHDVFYFHRSPEERAGTLVDGLDTELVRRIARAHPETPFRVQPVGSGPFFDQWIRLRLGAPAITYEVGDTTPPEVVRVKARTTAEELMRLLLARSLS